MTPDFRLYRGLEEAAGAFGPCAISIGVFDGVHCGHRRILRRVVETAAQQGWEAAAMTFDPHPAAIVAPQRAPRPLTTPEERATLMREEGITRALVVPFTVEFSHLSADEFVRRVLLEQLEARAVLVGDNFRFGYRHGGDTRLLAQLGQRHGFITEVIPAVRRRGRMVSSSEIRRLIEAGEVGKAARLLERPHAVEGEVVAGHGVGAKLTVPTLNLRPGEAVLPARGVYITRTRLEWSETAPWRPSVTNVGHQPSFTGRALAVETHLLEGLSGESPRRIRVEFLRRLREEKKFASAEELRAQILRDSARAARFFRQLAARRGAC
ncbi:MAG: bifunctional riboflavin kinase/FAD synthetase [Acidobacteria bacterium]|nr:bifunctional riboflavin kinase/FAD synthetase [Acidobacteriota bacterium]